MSTLVLPEPTHTHGATARRAHQLFLAGRAHAAQERWPHAAKAFAQAADLSRDSAYTLTAAHASIKAGQADHALPRLRALRRVHPDLTLAYTLESHAWLDAGRADEAVRVLQALPAEAPRDHIYHVSLAVALQRLNQHQPAVQLGELRHIGQKSGRVGRRQPRKWPMRANASFFGVGAEVALGWA